MREDIHIYQRKSDNTLFILAANVNTFNLISLYDQQTLNSNWYERETLMKQINNDFDYLGTLDSINISIKDIKTYKL